MKVLVTGGSGFIGSHVVDRLRARGHEPRIFDLVPSRHHAPVEVELVIGDLLDPAALRGALQGCDGVVHLAAVSDVDRVAADPATAKRVNVRGTHALLECARAGGVQRVLYASTVWVYGGAAGPRPLSEDAALPPPAHRYTATKLAGERLCRRYGALDGVAPTILRFGIPFGPRARPTAVVAAFVARALAGQPLLITGDGTQSRQFVYVEDLADGVAAALDPAAAGRTYNLVGDEQVNVRTIARVVCELIGEVPIVHGPSRPADLRPANVSGSRAARELGWQPTTPFVEGVRRYIKWLTGTVGRPRAATASMIHGNAAAVLRQEPSEL